MDRSMKIEHLESSLIPTSRTKMVQASYIKRLRLVKMITALLFPMVSYARKRCHLARLMIPVNSPRKCTTLSACM